MTGRELDRDEGTLHSAVQKTELTCSLPHFCERRIGKAGHRKGCPVRRLSSVFVRRVGGRRDVVAARTVANGGCLHKRARQNAFDRIRQRNNFWLFVFHVNHLLSFRISFS